MALTKKTESIILFITLGMIVLSSAYLVLLGPWGLVGKAGEVLSVCGDGDCDVTLLTLSDSIGDVVPKYLDIVSTEIKESDENLIFKMDIDYDLSNLSGYVTYAWFLDADNNSGTGQPQGATGNQVGSEYNLRAYYDPSSGWGGVVDDIIYSRGFPVTVTTEQNSVLLTVPKDSLNIFSNNKVLFRSFNGPAFDEGVVGSLNLDSDYLLKKGVLILIDSGFSNSISTSIMTYKNDLESEGLVVKTEEISNMLTPYDIRQKLKNYYVQPNWFMEGAVLVGDFPAAYTTMMTGAPHDGVYAMNMDSTDFYYMALNYNFIENPSDYISCTNLPPLPYTPTKTCVEGDPSLAGGFVHCINNYYCKEEHSMSMFADEYKVYLNIIDNQFDRLNFNAQIWISRISAQNLYYSGFSSSDIINTYFERNHNYRQGRYSPDKSLVLIDSENAQTDLHYMDNLNMADVFAETIYEVVSKSQYIAYLSEPGSRFLAIEAHSNPRKHDFGHESLGVNELNMIQKNNLVYFMSACSACRWDGIFGDNYMCGSYVFDPLHTKSLLVIGESGVGGFNNKQFFSEYMRNNEDADYGSVFLYLLNQDLGTNFLMNNHVLLGDPTLRVRMLEYTKTCNNNNFCEEELGESPESCTSDCIDGDRDNYLAEDDCDDSDATVYPGAPEICDGLDNDCDNPPLIDEDNADCSGSTPFCVNGNCIACINEGNCDVGENESNCSSDCGLVAYYKFEENATDETGVNNGTLLGGVDCTVAGIDGMGCGFDGVDEYVGVLKAPDTYTSYSVSVWFKTNVIDNTYRELIGAGSAHYLELYNGGIMSYTSGTATPSLWCYNKVNVSTWHHVVLTFNGTHKVIYLDGSDCSSVATNGSIILGNFAIGRQSYGTNGRYFNGTIDEVKFFDRALSIEEVLQSHQEYLCGDGVCGEGENESNCAVDCLVEVPVPVCGDGTCDVGENESNCPSDCSPVAYYKFEENATDETGVNNGTLNGGINCSVEGIVGLGCAFDGVDDMISVLHHESISFNSSEDFSVEVWIKTQTPGRYILSKGSPSLDLLGFYGVYIFNSGVLAGSIMNRSQSASSVTNGATVDDGLWHHVAVVFDRGDNQMLRYVDGYETGTVTTIGQTLDPYTTRPLVIGAYRGSSYDHFFDGTMDELKIYDSALSPGQILDSYLEFSCGNGVCSELEGENESNCAVDCLVEVPVPVCGDGTCDVGENESNCPSDCSPVAYYKFEENATDETGVNNGTLLGDVDCTVEGIDGVGCEFDGFYDMINVPHHESIDFDSSEDFSVEVWIKTQTQTHSRFILSKGSPDMGSKTLYSVYIMNSGILGGYILDGSQSASLSANGVAVDDGLWHHVAVVFGRGDNQMVRYVDGVQTGAVTTIGQTLDPSSTLPLKVGVYMGTPYDYFFNGTIDELKIYNSALSPGQILDSYLEFSCGNGVCSESEGENSENCLVDCPICECSGAACNDLNNGQRCDGCDWVAADIETCNNFDDDCDGFVDEDLTNQTTCGQGECSGNIGIETCSAGNWIGDTCNPFAGAVAETCNGVDDDCDGPTDENEYGSPLNKSCYYGPAGTAGVGLCHNGTETCVDGGWSGCVGNVTPVTELCTDFLDNDCDGESDHDDLLGGLHGDSDCAISVLSVDVSDSIACPNDEVNVSCSVSVADVNSVQVFIGDDNCSWKSDSYWEGNVAVFTHCIVGDLGGKNITCSIDPGKSYQQGDNKSFEITVGGVGCCSDYPDSGSCMSDTGCEWCGADCDDTKWTGRDAGGCVSEGSCTNSCHKDHCGAECDQDVGGCSDTLCYDYCSDGLTLNIVDNASNVCQDNCTCSQNPCSSETAIGCGITNCAYNNSVGNCSNPCEGQTGDDICGTCAPTCVCDDNYQDINNDMVLDGCEYYCEYTGDEVCDGMDNDCDNLIDEGCDSDLDGFVDDNVSCSGIPLCVDDDGDEFEGVCHNCSFEFLDCDDDKNLTYPNATEFCNNRDDDCDVLVDEDFDGDGDNFTLCSVPYNDCNDTNSSIYPGADESCDNKTGFDMVDNNCDGTIDLDCDSYCDKDGDNYSSHFVCLVAGYYYKDCNDNNALINPGEYDIPCDDIDQDCKGDPFNGTDEDGDLYKIEGELCGQIDCNDSETSINPGAAETCNGFDDNCDNVTDEGCSCGDCTDYDMCTSDDCVEGACVNEPVVPCCGNDECEDGENETSCLDDCFVVQPGSVCGDGLCITLGGENLSNCPEDCNDCVDLDEGLNYSVKSNTTGRLPASGDVFGGYTDHCVEFDNGTVIRPMEPILNCSGADCGVEEYYCDYSGQLDVYYVTHSHVYCDGGCYDGVCFNVSSYCGDGTCAAGENVTNCAADCLVEVPGPVCGDKYCGYGESCANCAVDCGVCRRSRGGGGAISKLPEKEEEVGEEVEVLVETEKGPDVEHPAEVSLRDVFGSGSYVGETDTYEGIAYEWSGSDWVEKSKGLTEAEVAEDVVIEELKEERSNIIFAVLAIIAVVAVLGFLGTGLFIHIKNRPMKLEPQEESAEQHGVDDEMMKAANDYVSAARSKGFSDEQIKKTMLEHNWPGDLIDHLLGKK